MKCHYEVLDVARDVNNEDLKKAYRKAALKWHPDKNLDNPDLAKEQFQLVQQAYEVLSDSHERAWYDAHRDAILKGGLGGDYKDDSLDVFPFFSSTCFKGFNDDEGGFYSVYREVFNKIAAEDAEYMEDGDSDFEVPGFGTSTSDFKEVVQPFYAYWLDYATKKSFSWLDQCDIRDLPNRRIAKLVEKENKKIRDKARKDRNEQIRNLVAFVRKRDKRVQAQAEIVKQQNAEKARLAEEKRISKLRERQQKLQNYQESEWSKFSNFENELKNIEKSLQAEYGDHDSSDEADESGIAENSGENDCNSEEFDALYCPACQKLFKTVKAFANHENSKKHKENVEILRQAMLEEEEADAEGDLEEEEEEIEEEEENSVDLEDENVEDLDSNGTSEASDCESKEKELKNDLQEEEKVLKESEKEEMDAGLEDQSDNSDLLDMPPKPKSRSKKQKRISSTLNAASSNSEDSASDGEELLMLSKKQRRKQQQMKIAETKANDFVENEITIPESADAETSCDKENGLAKTKLKGKKAKDARKLKKQNESSSNENTTTSKDKPDKSSVKKGNSKNVAVDSSSVDTEHTCVTCTSTFSSKNKLFDHLKRTGHSVFIPNKGNVVASGEEPKKGKGKGRKK